MRLAHLERRRWVEAISQINEEINDSSQTQAAIR